MIDILNLAFPFFGLIFIGFACGKWKKLPDEGLAWMNFFVLNVAMPALFFRILSKTPFEELAQVDFIKATTLATAGALAIAFLVGLVLRRGKLADATLAGVAGGFGNIGYMGPGLALATLGQEAAVPVALIFSFDCLLIFTLVPLLMAFSGASKGGIGRAVLDVASSIFLNPLLIAAALGVGAAAMHLEPPVAIARLLEFLYTSAAPCALFALGVTLALRPLARTPPEVAPLIVVKLALHPVLALLLLGHFGPFSALWVGTAVLMAALPPGLFAFILARQYGAWIEQASSAVLLGTLTSVVTLTGVMWLVQAGALPQIRLW